MQIPAWSQPQQPPSHALLHLTLISVSRGNELVMDWKGKFLPQVILVLENQEGRGSKTGTFHS